MATTKQALYTITLVEVTYEHETCATVPSLLTATRRLHGASCRPPPRAASAPTAPRPASISLSPHYPTVPRSGHALALAPARTRRGCRGTLPSGVISEVLIVVAIILTVVVERVPLGMVLQAVFAAADVAVRPVEIPVIVFVAVVEHEVSRINDHHSGPPSLDHNRTTP